VVKEEDPSCWRSGLPDHCARNDVEVVERFTYLGTQISKYGSCEAEISRRIAITRDCVRALQRHIWNVEVLRLTCQTQLSTTLRDRRLRFLVISQGPTVEWIIHGLFMAVQKSSAWCQLGNGLGIVIGGSGQCERLRSRIGHALDDNLLHSKLK